MRKKQVDEKTEPEKINKKRNKRTRKVKQKYIPQKALFGTAEDYYVYAMNAGEKILGALLGFCAGMFVFMVFFRNFFVSVIAGAVCTVPAIIKYRDYLKEKRLKNLLYQFRDMMESLTASYSAGKNTEGAFQDACADMINIYGEKADIVRELRWIVSGLYNGMNIDSLLMNFAMRSHLDDIESFATIFEVSSRYGGNLKEVVGETRSIINDKIETEMEIRTLLTANKNELNIMMVMPFVIMLMISGMGDMSIVQNTPGNVLIKCGVLLLFGVAYYMGRKIVDIEL